MLFRAVIWWWLSVFMPPQCFRLYYKCWRLHLHLVSLISCIKAMPLSHLLLNLLIWPAYITPDSKFEEFTAFWMKRVFFICFKFIPYWFQVPQSSYTAGFHKNSSAFWLSTTFFLVSFVPPNWGDPAFEATAEAHWTLAFLCIFSETTVSFLRCEDQSCPQCPVCGYVKLLCCGKVTPSVLFPVPPLVTPSVYGIL